MGGVGGGVFGCEPSVIRAITRQGSVTTNRICPFRLRRDRRGGDPDLPASDRLQPSLRVCVCVCVCVLLVILGYAVLPCLDTLQVIISY